MENSDNTSLSYYVCVSRVRFGMSCQYSCRVEAEFEPQTCLYSPCCQEWKLSGEEPKVYVCVSKLKLGTRCEYNCRVKSEFKPQACLLALCWQEWEEVDETRISTD